MRQLLLIKTSSMGDVVHNLPVVSDLIDAYPAAHIDWVVEEAFSAIPRLHPGIRRVLAVAVRRWRKHIFNRETRTEISALRNQLQKVQYDAILDTQGLLKSAVLARMACGRRHGPDLRSSREPLRPFYDRTYSIPWSLHAVERNRLLVSKALGYPLPERVDYGIAARAGDVEALGKFLPAGRLGEPYAVLLHATSEAKKEWPEQNWARLGQHLATTGITSVLPFGSQAEEARSRKLAAQIPGALVPPRLALYMLAALLSRARVVVGVDTGVTHLAVALDRPAIGIYCATDPAATGLYGSPRAVNLGGVGLMPAVGEVVAVLEKMQEGI